jgi:hypothetical protein
MVDRPGRVRLVDVVAEPNRARVQGVNLLAHLGGFLHAHVQCKLRAALIY